MIAVVATLGRDEVGEEGARLLRGWQLDCAALAKAPRRHRAIRAISSPKRGDGPRVDARRARVHRLLEARGPVAVSHAAARVAQSTYEPRTSTSTRRRSDSGTVTARRACGVLGFVREHACSISAPARVPPRFLRRARSVRRGGASPSMFRRPSSNAHVAKPRAKAFATSSYASPT